MIRAVCILSMLALFSGCGSDAIVPENAGVSMTYLVVQEGVGTNVVHYVIPHGSRIRTAHVNAIPAGAVPGRASASYRHQPDPPPDFMMSVESSATAAASQHAVIEEGFEGDIYFVVQCFGGAGAAAFFVVDQPTGTGRSR